MNKVKSLFSLLAVMLFMNAWSSTPINTSFTFKNVKHTLYLSIPSSYDGSKEYPLVISLHWCPGSTVEGYGKDFRDAFSKFSDSLNVIVACPDNKGSSISDDDIGILKATVDSVRNKYKIDTSAVFLTGMSCNGYVTVRQGLKKAYPFKGVFAWDPWIASIGKDEFDFNSKMPIVIAVGTSDQNYKMILNVFDSLKAHNANANLIIVEGVGHEMGFPSFTNQMIRCYKYLNDTNSISIAKINDIEIGDSEKTLEVTVSNKTGKNLALRAFICSKVIAKPSIAAMDNGKVKITISPIKGISGSTKVIFEAEEENGVGMEQTIFNVKASTSTALLNFNDEEISIYPNPANKILYVNVNSNISKLEIKDIYGRNIITISNPEITNKIDISNLSAGIYFIKGGNNNYSETKRIIINSKN